ncbi:MAG: hypothetical protein NTZ86_09200 [Legionellales bacterium]|nr:hypothetical protein [Legionellales bacterium]
MNKVIKKLILVSVTSILGFPVVSFGLQESKLPPRVFAWGNAGNRLFGESDAMIPLVGNSNQFFFMDLTGKYGNDNAGLLSAGLGSRIVVRDNTILGAYLFGDYNRTPNSNYFKVINPGIEGMTKEWDAHLNGYFPVGKKSKTMAIYTGTQAGISNTIFFSGHSQYDKLFDLVEDVGAGSDIEIGRTFTSLNQARLFGGGYYFSPKYSPAIRGVEGGIEMPLKYRGMQVGIRDSYDNINHNTNALTLRVTFGGLEQTQTADIHERMLDLIPRHLGNLRSGDGIPSQKSVVDTGGKTLIQDNIWFFNADGTPSMVEGFQSCTFEHPCIGLAQTQIDTINTLASNANFYLSSGTYNNPLMGSGLNFYNGQNVFGRTSDFTQLAIGNNRPLVNDTLIFNGDTNIYNLRVQGHSVQVLETGGMLVPFQVGVLTAPTSMGVINIYNSDINQSSTTNNAISVANNSNVSFLNIYNTNMTSDVSNSPGSLSIGVGNLRSSGLNIFDSTITTFNTDTANNNSLSFGLVNNEAGLVTIANTSINASLTHGGLLAGILNNSTVGGGNGTIMITGSTITANGNDANLVGGIFNQANNAEGDGANIDISQSTISVASNNNGGGTAAGVLTSGNGTLSLSNSSINATGDSGSISGLVVGDPTAAANVENTIISLFTSGTAVGTPIQNAGTLNDNGGNQCFQNGVPVPC